MMGPSSSGHWGPVTSTVDWCEENYAVSPYVCEWFNTLSSLLIVGVGLFGLLAYRRTLERRFLLAFATILLVGLGSIAFHGTLRFEFQMLDELPMLYSAIVMVFILLENRKERRFGSWFPWLLFAHAVLVTVLTAGFRGRLQFFLFHTSFGSMEMFGLYRIVRLGLSAREGGVRTLTRVGIASYVVAIGVWFVDLTQCSFLQSLRLRGLFNPELHAVWHMLVSVGLYLLLLVVAHERGETLCCHPTRAFLFRILPVVRYQKPW